MTGGTASGLCGVPASLLAGHLASCVRVCVRVWGHVCARTRVHCDRHRVICWGREPRGSQMLILLC